VVAGEQAGGQINAVHQGGRFKPTADRCAAVEGNEEPDPE
jgi:hypothetical protein